MLQSHKPSGSAIHLMTRNDVVRLEGQDAAMKGADRHDNPYRSSSADGVAWHQGFDSATNCRWQTPS